MAITYSDAKKKVAQFAGRGGKCPANSEVDSFLREVLDYMLISGQYGNLRKFVFTAVKGEITVPYELQTPLKVKIDNEVGTVMDRWYDYYPYNDLEGCLDANLIVESPGDSPLVYDLPPGGSYVGTLAICSEEEEAFIIVKGKDCTGREIFTTHKGEKILGEYLSIRKGEIRHTQVKFGHITEIVKSVTNGYVQLLWVNPDTSERGFLADYSPVEEHPRYRRFRLNTKCSPFAKVSVLGRIRLKSYYADNDLIPFDNLYALSMAAQAVNSNYNNDPQSAQAKDQMLLSLINRENNIKKINNGKPIEMFVPLSGGSIKNIIF